MIFFIFGVSNNLGFFLIWFFNLKFGVNCGKDGGKFSFEAR